MDLDNLPSPPHPRRGSEQPPEQEPLSAPQTPTASTPRRGHSKSPSLSLENIPQLPPPTKSERLRIALAQSQLQTSGTPNEHTTPSYDKRIVSSSGRLKFRSPSPVDRKLFVSEAGSGSNIENSKLDNSKSYSSKLNNKSDQKMDNLVPSSPPSFALGIAVGVGLALAKPLILHYLEIGAHYISIVVKYALIWFSIIGIAFGGYKALQVAAAKKKETENADKRTICTTPASTDQSKPRSRSTSPVKILSPSPKYAVRRKTPLKEEEYSYRPYPERTPLRSISSNSTNSFSIVSGEDIRYLERPVGESAFRLPRGYTT